MSLGRIFDISRRSLATYQKALEATSHNIANASNPNYSRQQIRLNPEQPQVMPDFIWGMGVKIDQVMRVRNDLTDSQIRTNNHVNSNSNRQSLLLGQVEEVFTEPSELGLGNLISNFFNSWQELSATPNSLPLRNSVVDAAKQMSSKVKSIYDNLDLIKHDIKNEFAEQTANINSLLSQVRDMNQKVFEASATGLSANDLMDERDRLLDDLSKIVNINVTYDDKGHANVSVGGVLGTDGHFSTNFKSVIEDGKLYLVTEKDGLRANLQGGELAGLSEVYSKKIPEYQSSLDQVVGQIVSSVNNAHLSGYSITDPALTAIPFFQSYSNGVLTINPQVENDPKLIAASGDGTVGNGSVAGIIGDLASQNLVNGGTIGDAYNSLVSRIGNDKKTTDILADSSQLVLNQLEIQRSSYSGVSLDEEMTNVIKFQRSYEAAAKLIKVADDILETLLNMV